MKFIYLVNPIAPITDNTKITPIKTIGIAYSVYNNVPTVINSKSQSKNDLLTFSTISVDTYDRSIGIKHINSTVIIKGLIPLV